MFQVKIDTVREMTTNGPTYMQGRQYYRQGLIKHLTFNQEKGIILAQVEGTRIYSVRIILDGNGTLHDASCTCSAFSAYWGLCKHIGAVLLYCIDTFGDEKTHIVPSLKPDELLVVSADLIESCCNNNKMQQQVLRRSRTKSRDFLSHLEHAIRLSHIEDKQPVKLQVVLQCARQASSTPSLSFAMGIDTLHPVTNVEQFAEAISRDLSLELDKDFIFDPLIHAFLPQDLPLIELIHDAFEHDYKSVFGTSHTSSHNQTFVLNPRRFADFLRISATLSDCSWKSARNAKVLPVRVREDQLPIRLTLMRSTGSNRKSLPYQLKWTVRQSIQQLTASRNVFLVNQVFYLPPPDTIRLLEPVLSHFNVPGSHTLDLNNQEASWLISVQDQSFRSVCPIDLHPNLINQVIQKPLQANVSLDAIDMELKADITYQYGPITINPLQRNDQSDNHPLIKRDLKKEQTILRDLTESGFTQQGQSLRLKDTDAIYRFVRDSYGTLRQRASLQFSPAASRIVIYPAPDIRFNFRWQEDADGLVLEQHHDGLDQDSFDRYCQALRENRSFVRNRDGSFRQVNLDQRERFLEIVSLLHFWQIDLLPDHVLARYLSLSLIAFFSLDEGVKPVDPIKQAEHSQDCVQVDDKIQQMIRHLHHPSSLSCQIPAALKKQLRPYQKTGVQWLYMLYTYGLGGILADDMGLGKTIQTITFIHMLWRRFKKTSLVIAPTSLIYNWSSEFEKFDPKLPILLIDGNRRQRNSLFNEIGKYACVITSYALLRRDIDEIKDFPFGSCFLDEAQNIKNPETLNARSVKQITTERAFALTGTPIENSLLELWSIFDFVLPGFLHGQKYFQTQYEQPVMKDQNTQVLESLHQQIMPFILRRLKKDVLTELPDKIESHTICDMTECQREIYETFLKRSREDLKQEIALNGYARSQIYILALLTRLRQICCHPSLFLKQYDGGSGKLMLLEELLSGCYSSGHRVLVFSQFTSMLEIIRKRLMDQGVRPFYIDGQVSSEERMNQVSRFYDGEGSLFLISLRAGGTGLNLTGADTVIHYDPWWNPAVEEQATDRAYRIGQENIVQVFKLCTRHSVEEKILSLQQKKQNLIDAVIKPGQNLLSKMTVEEVMRLFEP